MNRQMLCVAFAAAMLALPRAGAAQDFRATVLAQLDTVARPLVQNGFRPEPAVFDRQAVVGALAKGATSMMEVTLVGGVNYFIAGACDEDCSDLDLRIFAADNTTPVAEDTADDDAPMLNFKAPRSGRYMLAVDMAECKESMCYYGYRVYRK
jgi:hypothetical protein